jgi:hypothetical protein
MRFQDRLALTLLAMLAALAGCTPKHIPCAPPPETVYLPTKERPISHIYQSSRLTGLVFGGEDGTGRNILRRSDDMAAMAVCPNGPLAAALSWDSKTGRAWVTFYNVSAQVIAKVDLPDKAPDYCWGGNLFLGPRGEAIVQAIPLPPPFSVLATHAMPFDPGKPPPPCNYYYVNTKGAALPLALEQQGKACFTVSSGFAFLVPTLCVSANEPSTCRLMRYTAPNELAWVVEVKAESFVSDMPQAQDSGFDVALVLRWGFLRFRSDGTWEYQKRPRDQFAKENPGYAERAGGFYEKEYLGKALDQFAAFASPTRQELEAVQKELRRFIYNFLEALVADEDCLTPEHHRDCLARLDEAVRPLLSEAKYQKFIEWRSDETGATNAMAFLFKAPDPKHYEDRYTVTTITPAKTFRLK